MKNIARSQFLKTVGALGFLCSCLLFVCSGCICPLIIPDPPPKEESWPSWAPDSQRLVYECYLDGPIKEGSRNIFDLGEAEGVFQSYYAPEAADLCISDINEHNQVRLTEDSSGDWHPIWSPDGLQIAYLRQDGIYLITPEGQERRQLVPLDNSLIELGWMPEEDISLAWSPEGDRLLFSGCLDNPDHDVYVVNADTGVMTNLTPDSRMHEIFPMWISNGTKVVFLSTASSSYSWSTCDLKHDYPHQLKVINADGSSESVVYDEEFYYASVSVSNSGQIAFVTNMTSTTAYDYSLPSAYNGSLYRMDLEDGTLIEMIAVKDYDDVVLSPSWSPGEGSIVYESFLRLKILNVETGEILELPQTEPFIDNFVWSPNSQKIAVTTSVSENMARDTEEHISVFDIQSQTFHPLIQEPSSP